MSILLSSLGRGGSSQPEELDAASAIAHDVGGLPLALVHLGGIARDRDSSITQLRGVYANHRDRLLRKTLTSSSYHHTLETVWTSAFLVLSEKAQQLLWLLSVLDPDSVEQELL